METDNQTIKTITSSADVLAGESHKETRCECESESSNNKNNSDRIVQCVVETNDITSKDGAEQVVDCVEINKSESLTNNEQK